MKILLAFSAVVLTFFSSANAKIYNFQIFQIDAVNDGILDFFTDYKFTSECAIEIADSAIAPGAFINFQSPDFKNLSCTISGNDGPYSFSYSGPGSADQYEGDIFSNSFDYGLLFDSDMQPLRFSGRTEAGGEVTGAIGFYDSNGDDQRFGSSTSYLSVRVDDRFDVPSAVLLEPAFIGTIERPIGHITKANIVPEGTKIALLNGEFRFEEGSVNDNGDSVNPTLDLRGLLTFDEQLVTPKMRITQAVFEENDKKEINLVHERTTAVLLGRGPLFSDRKVEFLITDKDGNKVFPENTDKITEENFEQVTGSDEKAFYCNIDNSYCNLEAGKEYLFRVQFNDENLPKDTQAVNIIDTLSLAVSLFFVTPTTQCMDQFCGYSESEIASYTQDLSSAIMDRFPLGKNDLSVFFENPRSFNASPSTGLRGGMDLKDYSADEQKAIRWMAKSGVINRALILFGSQYLLERGEPGMYAGFVNGVLGVSGTNPIGFVNYDLVARKQSAVHELGHTLGLYLQTKMHDPRATEDKTELYQISPVCGDAATWFSLKDRAVVESPKSFMGAGSAFFTKGCGEIDDYGVITASWNELTDVLSTGTVDPELIVVTGFLEIDGKISNLNVLEQVGFPMSNGGASGRVEFFDQSGRPIRSDAIVLPEGIIFRPEGLEGEDVSADIREATTRPFHFILEYPSGAATLKISDNSGLTSPAYDLHSANLDTLNRDVQEACEINLDQQNFRNNEIARFKSIVRNGDISASNLTELSQFLKILYPDNCKVRSTAPGTKQTFLEYADKLTDRIADRFEVTLSELAGDLDLDGDVDRNDLNILLTSRNQPASGPDDPKDLDGDGRITGLDARQLTQLCTRPRCATQ